MSVRLRHALAFLPLVRRRPAAGPRPCGRCRAPLRPVGTHHRSVPERSLHGAGSAQQHPVARQPAQARLRCPGDRLPGHRRHQHARRLQPAAAAVHPLLRPDRSGEREQRHGVPGQPGGCARRPRRTRRRHQSDRVGPGHPHAARGIGRASRPAHPLLAGRDHRCEGRRRSADRAGSLRRFPGRSPTPVPPARPRARGLSPRAQAGPGPRAGAPPPRRGRQHLHDPERDGRAREDPPADQAENPGGGDPRHLPAQ